MDKPISVGDLVVVLHGCCGQYSGAIRRVTGFDTMADAVCPRCKTEHLNLRRVRFSRDDAMPQAAPLHEVRRIPPTEELGIVDEREGLHA